MPYICSPLKLDYGDQKYVLHRFLSGCEIGVGQKKSGAFTLSEQLLKGPTRSLRGQWRLRPLGYSGNHLDYRDSMHSCERSP